MAFFFAAVLSLITPCMVSHTACRACKVAVERGKRETEEGRGSLVGRIKRYLTDGSRDALSGVNYQLLRGEVACVDGACDVKSLQRFVACGEPCGDRSRAVSDEWQTNSSLSDMQRTQHGQPGLEVKTARAVNSPGWQENERGRARGSMCMC